MRDRGDRLQPTTHDLERRLDELSDRYERLKEAQELAGIGTWSWDFGSDQMIWSDELFRIHGIAPGDEVPSLSGFLALVHPEDRPLLFEASRRAHHGGTGASLRYRIVRSDGEVRFLSGKGAVALDGTGAPVRFFGTAVDVTDRLRADEQSAHHSEHDPLTGLPNRGRFRVGLRRAVGRANEHNLSVAVLHVDLRAFKLVNDSIGHDGGDELLRQVGSRLGLELEEAGVVARASGAEFLVLADNLHLAGTRPSDSVARSQAIDAALEVVAAIHSALSKPFRVGDEDIYQGATVGVGVLPVTADDADALLEQAEAAVYQAKRLGTGRAAVYETEAGDPRARLSLSARLRRALDKDEFCLHFQPIVDLADGNMVGAEALIRWDERGEGLVSPGEFIPIAEENGLIEPIGQWVLGEACRQASEWRRAGAGFAVSFNLSLAQMWQPDIADRTIALVEASDIEPSDLIVEITESASMVDFDRVERVLRRFADCGFRIAIDDFGTGHSSLARLGRLPAHMLKIDRSFIAGVPEDPAAMTLVTKIIDLAAELGLVTVGEGIETEEQLAFLTHHGCTLGQGYLLGRPVPAAELAVPAGSG